MDELKGKKDYFGYSNFPFIGDFGYPNVVGGPVIADNNSEIFSSAELYGKKIDEIIKMRVNTLRSKHAVNITKLEGPGINELQQLALSVLPIDTEVYFKKEVKIDFGFDDIVAPLGPSVDVEKMKICDNPKVPRQFDEVVNDNLKASDAINVLSNYGFDVDDISRLLSVGLLGKEKKLVPTRWAITATDSNVVKQNLEEIKEFEQIENYCIASETYLGNHFEIIFAPGNWSFEMIEVYAPGCLWVTKGEGATVINDWEPYEGRKNYASNITGAYYAAQLACTEHLKKIKKQASVIVVREITPDYSAPLGVWVIRETVRNALNKFETTNGLDDAVITISDRFKTKNLWKNKSELLKRLKSRSIMIDYFGKF